MRSDILAATGLLNDAKRARRERVKSHANLSERPWTRAMVARAMPNVSTGQDRHDPGHPAGVKVFRPIDASTAAGESLWGVRVNFPRGSARFLR